LVFVLEVVVFLLGINFWSFNFTPNSGILQLTPNNILLIEFSKTNKLVSFGYKFGRKKLSLKEPDNEVHSPPFALYSSAMIPNKPNILLYRSNVIMWVGNNEIQISQIIMNDKGQDSHLRCASII